MNNHYLKLLVFFQQFLAFDRCLIYEKIYNLCQELFNNQPNNVDINNDILRINYNLAKKKLNKSITKSNLEYIFNQKEDSIEKAAAYVLIDKIDEATKLIMKEIEKDYHYYYYLQIMPVFSNINFENLRLSEIENSVHQSLNLLIKLIAYS